MENNDRELFNKIASEYSRKDTYSVSATVRRFQVKTLIDILIEKSGKNKFFQIIDIGCGSGANSVFFREYCTIYKGVDFSKGLVDIAQRSYRSEGTEFICTDIMKLDDSVYDIVTGIGILHHLPDLGSYLKKIASLGNMDSYFVFLEPYGGNPFIQLLRNVRKFIDKSYSKTQNFFTKKDIRESFKKAGLEIIEIRNTGYFSPPLAQIILKPAFIFLPIAEMLISADMFIQRYIPNFLSWNISIIARRKS